MDQNMWRDIAIKMRQQISSLEYDKDLHWNQIMEIKSQLQNLEAEVELLKFQLKHGKVTPGCEPCGVTEVDTMSEESEPKVYCHECRYAGTVFSCSNPKMGGFQVDCNPNNGCKYFEPERRKR